MFHQTVANSIKVHDIKTSIRKAASWLLCIFSHACLFGQFTEESILPYVLDMKLTNRIRDHLPGNPTVQGIRQGLQDVLSRAKTPATPSVMQTRLLWGHIAMTKRMPRVGVTTSLKSRFPRLVSLPTPYSEENAVQTATLGMGSSRKNCPHIYMRYRTDGIYP